MRGRIFDLDRKILAIYAILFISNLVLWMLMLDINPDITKFNFNDLSHYFTIASALIIFAYISSRLPALRSLGNSSLYEIAYLLIMGLVGLIVSYFNGIVNDSIVLEPFINMFNVLAIILIVMIFATRLKSFKAVIHREHTRNDIIVCMIAFVIMGLLATALTKNLGNSSANVRSMTVMIAGLFGGPMIGIPTAVAASAFRFAIGGPTQVPGALSTLICGVMASAIYVWNGNRFLRTFQSAILMFLFMGFEMLLIALMIPDSIAFPRIMEIYAPMTFVSVIGIILFKMVITETREKGSDDPVDMREELESLKATLKESEEKINALEEELDRKSD